MKKLLGLIIIIISIAIISVYFYQKLNKTITKNQQKESQIMVNLINKKVAMIVASENFRDEEYLIPKDILEKRGVEVKTASNKLDIAKGAGGTEVKIDLLVSDIKPSDFDAVIFVGGPGCLQNLDNEISYNLVKAVIKENKILAAICISPVILAKAGVLSGKQATVWSSPFDKQPIKILKENGAKYLREKVVIDGKIITANGPAAAKEFGEAILRVLEKF
jgi:protease I